MGNGQVLGTDPVPTFLLRVLEALNCLKSKNRRGTSIKEITEFVNSSYRHCNGDILSQVEQFLKCNVATLYVNTDVCVCVRARRLFCNRFKTLNYIFTRRWIIFLCEGLLFKNSFWS